MIDTTDSAGQGGALYIEVSNEMASDSLSLRFWDHLVSGRMNVTPGVAAKAAGTEGNMFEGSRNFRVFEAAFPPVARRGFFDLSMGGSRLVRQWIYLPGDSLRLRVDHSSGTFLFGGPDAAFYRLQDEVDRIFKEERFNTDPVLFSADREFYRSDSITESLWNRSRTRPENLYVRMQLIGDAEEAWTETLRYISSHGLDHPAFTILHRHRDVLPAPRLALVEAAIKGQILYNGIQKSELAWHAIKQDPAKLAKLRDWVDTFGLATQEISHPLLAQGFYHFALMESHARQIPIEQVYAPLPNPLREEVIAFYILDNFNRMEDRLPEVIAQNLPLVESDWIKRRFYGLLANAAGTFSAEGIYLPDGSKLDPASLQGKTVLIHYWISGCVFCVEEHRRLMAGLSERYSDSDQILILTVNGDANAENWRRSLASGKYASESSLNAWVPRGTGVLKTYSINSYPQKMIVSKEGKILLQSILLMEPEDLIRRLEQDADPMTFLSPTKPTQP
ncbi:TlpA family protein disulfide reductase [Algoriphagus sp. H41]|uniref:TlpA family protein disulfide reductase n=1 Tax=Algoriphagus oliviformis TaxID=2811231 RepID=A0ABS3C8L3_9BACT|nr:TlpA disulfide reductase family protein [Algoriphagus oliviformis]MBN7813432.1 TlpA family protein disulfide reductase [Algoriphagus oliviformis]